MHGLQVTIHDAQPARYPLFDDQILDPEFADSDGNPTPGLYQAGAIAEKHPVDASLLWRIRCPERSYLAVAGHTQHLAARLVQEIGFIAPDKECCGLIRIQTR